MSEGTGATMVDAQFSVARILTPLPGFEQFYQGKSGQTPIAFPGTLDQRAGQTGVSPNLLRGIPVPLGSCVKLWIPVASTPDPEDPDNLVLSTDYKYRLIWRLRNVGDFRNPAPGQVRPPWHLPTQGFGAPDEDSQRFPIPAAYDVVGFQQAQPDGNQNGQLQLQVEEVSPVKMYAPPNLLRPLQPDSQSGFGDAQQGILNPATAGLAAATPSFAVFETRCKGDELIIFVNRREDAQAWDFADPTIDLPFSNIYGNGNGEHEVFKNNGIYVMTGTAP